MAGHRIVLIGGGVRSGKSAFALRRAAALGERRLFVATAEARDEEMKARIVRHQVERGAAFATLEAPRDLVASLRSVRERDVVVIDCLTLWISNLLCDGLEARDIDARVAELATCLGEGPFHSVLVTNEVGMGIVPDNPLARAFRDATGRAHQTLGRVAHEVYFGVMGQLLRLKPAPIEAVVGAP